MSLRGSYLMACNSHWLSWGAGFWDVSAPEVAAYHYLAYARGANISFEWDLCHYISNASKMALKTPRDRI